MLQFSTYYHIFNHANGDDNLFREEKNYEFFLKKYHQHIDPVAETIAWCLMKNHFHLLVKIKEGETLRLLDRPGFKNLDGLDGKAVSNLLSRQFSNFFNSYAKAFNKSYNRRGSLFIKNFKRKAVKSERYLRQLILYIHLNPVKHGFVTDFENWSHSSFTIFPELHPERMQWLFGTKNDYIQTHLAAKSNFKNYQKIEDDLT